MISIQLFENKEKVIKARKMKVLINGTQACLRQLYQYQVFSLLKIGSLVICRCCKKASIQFQVTSSGSDNLKLFLTLYYVFYLVK